MENFYRNNLIEFALLQLNKKYTWNSRGPDEFDCSGLTYYVYKELQEIPHYEKENVLLMYSQYKKMGGNSFIDDIMEEIKDLPIKK